MGLFEQFPFTNFHQLNLDWILQQIKNMSEHAVLSVNGQTGEVILYQSENIVFPEVESDQWRMVRIADGHTAGVLFNQDYMYVMYDNTADRVYTMNHPPAYPVTSVDGQTGDVTVFPQAAVRLPDVTDDYTNIRRQIQTGGVDNIVGIELKQNKAYRMKDQYRYEMYDSDNPPPYPVSSVNGQTGAVILAIPFDSPLTDSTWMATEPSADHTAGLARETIDGTVEIYTVTTGTDAAAWISFVSADDQYSYTKKLLTTDDIPSSSGVVSLNGMTGVVTLTGSDLYIDNSHNITIPAVVDQLQKDLAILVSGNTAAVNVTAGQYVVVHGSTITGVSDGLYTAVNNVSSGTPFTAADLAAVPAGGLNDLGAQINTLNSKINSIDSVPEGIVTWNTTNVTGDNNKNRWFRMANLVVVGLEFTPLSGKIANGNVICSGLPNPRNSNTTVVSSNNRQMHLNASGELVWWYPSETQDLSRVDITLVYFTSGY